MNKLRLLPLYIILALFSGTALLYFRWPFYEHAVVMALISVPIIFLVSRKWIPIIPLSVLVVSIGYASQEPDAVLQSIGTYFLLSVFQFSLSTAADKLKQVAEESGQLARQRDSLSQQSGELRTLNLQEFVEQALWMLKTNHRKDHTWFMEVVPSINCPVLTAELEQTALESIARHRDLVTSKQGAVYLLVKETEELSLQSLISCLEKTLQANEDSPDYEIRKTRINKVGEMRSLLN